MDRLKEIDKKLIPLRRVHANYFPSFDRFLLIDSDQTRRIRFDFRRRRVISTVPQRSGEHRAYRLFVTQRSLKGMPNYRCQLSRIESRASFPSNWIRSTHRRSLAERANDPFSGRIRSSYRPVKAFRKWKHADIETLDSGSPRLMLPYTLDDSF